MISNEYKIIAILAILTICIYLMNKKLKKSESSIANLKLEHENNLKIKDKLESDSKIESLSEESVSKLISDNNQKMVTYITKIFDEIKQKLIVSEKEIIKLNTIQMDLIKKFNLLWGDFYSKSNVDSSDRSLQLNSSKKIIGKINNEEATFEASLHNEIKKVDDQRMELNQSVALDQCVALNTKDSAESEESTQNGYDLSGSESDLEQSSVELGEKQNTIQSNAVDDSDNIAIYSNDYEETSGLIDSEIDSIQNICSNDSNQESDPSEPTEESIEELSQCVALNANNENLSDQLNSKESSDINQKINLVEVSLQNKKLHELKCIAEENGIELLNGKKKKTKKELIDEINLVRESSNKTNRTNIVDSN